MIRASLPWIVVALGVDATAQTAPKFSTEVQSLRMHYEAELTAAAKPIQARYIGELQALQRSLTQKGDLNGALAAQAELARLTTPAGKVVGSSVQFNFTETVWESDLQDSKAEFRTAGEFREHWNKHHFTGTWKPVSEIEAEVARSDGKVYHFRYNAEKDKLWRKEPGDGWHRAN